MNVQKIFQEMNEIQNSLLDFLDDEVVDDKKYEDFKILIEKFKIREQRHEFENILHLIAKISNNHHRYPNFIKKIETILTFYKADIENFFSNTEIFNIFKGNKRLLLFLIKTKIIKFDEYIITEITTKIRYLNNYYPLYFLPEIKPFINEKWFPSDIQCNKYDFYSELKKELPEDFEENRQIGENENYLCKARVFLN